MSFHSTPTPYTLSFATSCYINSLLTRFGSTESLYPPWMVSFLQLWHLLTFDWVRQESAGVFFWHASLLHCQNSSWRVKCSIFTLSCVFAPLANQHKQGRIPSLLMCQHQHVLLCIQQCVFNLVFNVRFEALECVEYLTALPVEVDFRKLVYPYRRNLN